MIHFAARFDLQEMLEKNEKKKKKTFVVEESSVTFTTRWGVALQNGQEWAFIAGILWK